MEKGDKKTIVEIREQIELARKMNMKIPNGQDRR